MTRAAAVRRRAAERPSAAAGLRLVRRAFRPEPRSRDRGPDARTAELLAALQERDVRLQEVHHRVKNHLQLVSSLINMQLRSLGDGAGRDALMDCQSRVQAMALIHEKLTRSADYGEVPFSEYARSLAAAVFAAASSRDVSLEVVVEDLALAVDEAVPCGLILNELITNALQHAFPQGRPGTIRVELRRVGRGGFRLMVSDDGVGLPASFDLEQVPSLGLQLLRMLARQLGAALEVQTAGGACFRLTVPAQP